MVIPFAVKHRDRQKSGRVSAGFSLVEVMLAATLGSLALALVGSLFISAQKIARQKSQQLYLLQSMSNAFQTIEEDIQRAGFDNGFGHTLRLMSAANVIEQNGASEFGLAYYREMASNDNYRMVRYYLSSGKLMVCEQGSALSSAIKPLHQIQACRSLLDERVLQVTSFAITSSPLSNSHAYSALWHLTLAVQSLDLNDSRQLTVDVTQRNWQ